MTSAFLWGCGDGKSGSVVDGGRDGSIVATADAPVSGDDLGQGADGELALDAGHELDAQLAYDGRPASRDAEAAGERDVAGDAVGAPSDGGGLEALDGGPSDDDIVFDGMDTDGVRKILLWSAGTTVAIPLGTGYPGSNPSARSDGRAVLLQSLATDDEPSGLMLVDDFTRPARFFGERSAGYEREPAWSPDGRYVAFIAHAEDPSGDVWVAEVAGDRLQDIRNLTPCTICQPGREAETTPAWSPDGQQLAFTSYAGVSPAIWVMNADGSGGHPVTVTDGQAADYFPAWSPDGRFIMFQRNSSGPARVGIVALADGSTRFLDLPGPSYDPCWSPDGRKIALAMRTGADTDIVIVTPEGVELARLVRPGRDSHPAWLPRTVGQPH